MIEDQVGAFVRSVYNRASGSIHVQRTKQEVLSIQRFVETALVELLQLRGLRLGILPERLTTSR